MTNPTNNKWAFFGTDQFSVTVLDELKSAGFLPSVVVTVENKPKGRKLVLTPPEVKIWAERENVPCIQPRSLRTPEGFEMVKEKTDEMDFFVVASYGKIIPQTILDIAKLGTLNVHPSLLPKLRGASPIESAILTEQETGVSIMRLDAEMDHGPVVAQEKIISWGDEANQIPYTEDLEKMLGSAGGKLLADVLPDWLEGKISEHEQDHSIVTMCGKIEKTDGALNLDDSAETNLRKIRAYHVWPGAYFFFTHKDRKIRIVVKTAHIENGKLVLDRIVPEGKKEMSYADFIKTK